MQHDMVAWRPTPEGQAGKEKSYTMREADIESKIAAPVGSVSGVFLEKTYTDESTG